MKRYFIIFNLFTKNKIRTQYESIFKLLKIKESIAAYTILMFWRLIMGGILMVFLFHFISLETYKLQVFYLSSILLFAVNADLWIRGSRYASSPKNAEFLTMTGVGDKQMFKSLLLLEYLWVKINGLDKVVPAALLLLFLLGIRGLVWIAVLECLSIALCLFHSTRKMRANSGGQPWAWELFKFVLGRLLAFSITYYIVEFLAKAVILMSRHLDFAHGFDGDTEKQMKMLMDTEWSSFFHTINRFNAGVLHFLQGNTLFLALFLFVVLGLALMAAIAPNYRIPVKKIADSKLAESYLGFLKNLMNRKKTDFLAEKDLRLIRWGTEPGFLKNVLSVLCFFMDFAVLSAVYLVLVKYCNSMWLISLLTVFFFGNLVMNQAMNITASLKSVLRMKQDLPLMDLYKMSRKTIEDVYCSKLSLLRLFLRIPLLLYGLLAAVAAIFYISSIGVLAVTVLSLILCSILMYYFAPELALYMAPLMCSAAGAKEQEGQDDETLGDEIGLKFYQTPKKVLVWPMMYFLMANAILNFVPPGAWKIVFALYILYMLVVVLVLHKGFQKIVEKGVDALYGNKKTDSKSCEV